MEVEEGGRILSDAGRRGAAGQSPSSHRPSYDLSDISGVPNSSLFWSRSLLLVLSATRVSQSRAPDPVAEITRPEIPRDPPRNNPLVRRNETAIC